MSIQALAAVIESQLYAGATYGILLSLANHADTEGYVYVGYGRMAEEARSAERHVKRVMKAICVDVMRDAERYPDEAAHEAALSAAPVWRLSEQGGPRGTNEYQINMDLFKAARAAVEQARRDRRAGRPKKGVTSGAAPPEIGVTSGAFRPLEMGVTFEMGVTSGARGGDIWSHPRGDIRSHPNRPSEGTESRASEGALCGRDLEAQGATPAASAPGCDADGSATGCEGEGGAHPADRWREARRAARSRFGDIGYSSEISRLSAEGAVVIAASRFDVAAIARRYGPFFKQYGFVSVRGPGSGDEEVRL